MEKDQSTHDAPQTEPDAPREHHEGRVSAESMKDILEKVFLLGVGASALALDRVREVIDDFVKRGRLSADDGRRLAEEVSVRSRDEARHALGRLESTMQSTYKDVGLATKTDLEDVDFRLRQLEHRVHLLERDADHTAAQSLT